MKVGVTGADGRVGRAVVSELRNHGYKVKAISMETWEDAPADVEKAVADIRNFEQLFEAFSGCQAIIHLAAIPSPLHHPDHVVFHNNVMGMYHAALAAGLHGIKRMAAASSDCAIGITFSHRKTEPVYLPIDEEHPATPDNSYGQSKLVGELICEGMAKRFGMSIASLRITYVTSPDLYRQQSFLRQLDQPESDAINNLWSYVDIRDAARAFRLAIETDLKGHEVFHISAANTRSRVPSKELIERFFPNAVVKKPFHGNESLEDSSKAARLLNYVPRHSWNDTE